MTDTTTQTDPFAPPIPDDPLTIGGEQETAIQLIQPLWRPVPNALDTNLLAVTAETSAETRTAGAANIASEVKTLVGDLFGIPREEGTPAISSITVTAIDTLGHADLVDCSTVHLGETELVTTAALVIAPGASSGVVPIEAVEVGAQFNGQSGAVEIDALDWIDTVTLDAALSAGVDREDDLIYAVRMAEEVQTLSPAVLNAADAVVRAKRHPVVGWAYAIDHYDATTDTSGVALTCTVVIAQVDGTAVPDYVLAEVQADLLAHAVLNLVIRVVNPTYVPVSVTAAVVKHSGWTDADVIANATARLAGTTSPAGWLAPPYGLSPNYIPTRRLHKNELIASADLGLGVDYVSTLAIGDGSSDHVDLSSPIVLPSTGTITVTIASS